MVSFKVPTFSERQAAAAEARQKALEKLKSRPPIDEATLAARKEAAERRDAAAAEKRAEKKAAIEAAKAEARAAAEAKTVASEKTDAERKAERDRRYALRKARKK